MSFISDDEDEEGSGIGPWPMVIEVVEVDNPVIAQLHGPDGDVLIELHERRTVPFGFQ